MTASVTLIDDVSDLNLEKNGSVGNTITLSATRFPSNIDYFSFNFYNVYNDTYRLSPPNSLNINGYMLIKNSLNDTPLYQVDISQGRLQNGGGELDRKLTYFKINNINSEHLTIEWNPDILNASEYFSEYVKANFYELEPYIELIHSNESNSYNYQDINFDKIIVLGNLRYFEFYTYNINSIHSINLVDEFSNKFSLNITFDTNKYRATLLTNGKNIKSKSYQIKFECENLKGETVTIEHDRTGALIKINAIIPYVFTYDSIISISNTINDLTVKIDLDDFIENSSVNKTWTTFWDTHNWTDFDIKFKYDNNEVLTTSFTNTPQRIFELTMLLTQLKSDVSFAFEIIWKKNPKYVPNGTIVYTSSNFTLVNQEINYKKFELSPKSNTDNLLFQKDDQYIYMYETTPEIFKNDIISNSIVEYSVHYLKNSDEHDLNDLNDIDKAQLRLKLKKIGTNDTIDFDTLETFIFTKVNFSAFHTPTITPKSNIDYFKEKTFRFDVSNNKYSFSFGVTTYDIIFKSGKYTINSSNKSNIKITDLITEKDNVEIDVLPYLFTHGENELIFFMENTLKGVESIHLRSSIVYKTITSNHIDIVLNVESNALVSCKVQ